jgi:hypothetical protein
MVMASIFLSHSHTDREFARRLAADLRLAGVKVWVDEAEIRPGDSLFDRLEHGIRESDYVGVILSPEAVASRWVRVELNAALQLEVRSGAIKVVPIVSRHCEMPAFLLDKIHIDFTEPHRYHAAAAETIRFLLGGAPPVWLTGKEAARLVKLKQRPTGDLLFLSQQGVTQQYIQHSVMLGVSGDWLFSDVKSGRSRVWVVDFFDAATSTVYPFGVRDGKTSACAEASLGNAPPVIDFTFLDSDVIVPRAVRAAQAAGFIPAMADAYFATSSLKYSGQRSVHLWTISFLDVTLSRATCGVLVDARTGAVLWCERAP